MGIEDLSLEVKRELEGQSRRQTGMRSRRLSFEESGEGSKSARVERKKKKEFWIWGY